MALSAQPPLDASSLITAQFASLPAWDSLTTHIREYFYEPDLGALEIALSAATSHYHKGADPAWLFVLGPSGGDKGSVVINSCLAMSNAHLMGDLTPKTFLSGYTGAPNASLLTQIGSGILVFKDFTTFMSKRQEEQAEIAAQLREIYDGFWKRNTGKGVELEWHGKMTVIAAATPALERYWATLGDLGERFLQVRIARKDGLRQAEYAQRQAGKEEFITKHMRELASQLMCSSPPIAVPPPILSQPQRYRISCMSELLAHSRGKVPHGPKGDIIGIAEIENSSRSSKELNSLVSGHAALFRRSSIDEHLDMWVAARVAKNSIPINRYLVLSTLAASSEPVPTIDLLRKTRMPESSARFILGDLESLGLVLSQSGSLENSHSLVEEYREMWESAFAQPPVN